MIRHAFLFLGIVFATSVSQARVFNINKESFAAYFDASGGSSHLGTSALDGEAGSSISYTGDVSYNYSGEFGFIYSRPLASLRFGFEILKPSALTGAVASNATDELYSADSTILGYAPKLSLEINVHGNATSRSFISLGAGSASVTMTNSYTLTAAGQAAYAGVTDHETEAKGTATLLNATLGYEGLLTDTTTLVFEFGYRQLKITNLEHTKSVTTFNGTVASGDPVLNSAGEQRELDLSGAFIAIGFRFYL